MATPRPLHIVTPLVYSAPLSQKARCKIFLKLDALQPSSSFKIRGIGAVCQAAYAAHGARTHLVSSSGGNAGLAAAYAARALGVRCTVFCPTSTDTHIVELLRSEQATVVVGGQAWDEADVQARELVESEPAAIYIHPFEGGELRKGHATLVDEIFAQLKEQEGVDKPDAIVCSVGGGGLLAGIIQGLDSRASAGAGAGADLELRDHKKVNIVAVEDFGADSFAQSFKKGELVTLPAITSKATSMGARRCSATALRAAQRYASSGSHEGTSTSTSINKTVSNTSASPSTSPSPFSTLVVTDKMSASAAWQFSRDHRLMVELACAASLTPAYFPNLLPHLLSDWSPDSNIVLVVCGGSKVNARSLVMWQEEEEKGQGQGQGGKGEEGEGSGSAQGGRVSLEAEINGRRI